MCSSSYWILLLKTTLFPRTGLSLDKRSLCECTLWCHRWGTHAKIQKRNKKSCNWTHLKLNIGWHAP